MRPYARLEEFYVKTPIGQLRIWSPETYREDEVPQICVDFIHVEGDIPLTRITYDHEKNEVVTNAYADMYSDDPTHVARHKGLDLL